MKIKFENSTEASFYDYLVGNRGYKQSTAMDYVRRIRRIESMDTLVKKNLDNVIDDYENGAHKMVNHSAHNAYSCALKRLREFQGTL